MFSLRVSLPGFPLDKNLLPFLFRLSSVQHSLLLPLEASGSELTVAEIPLVLGVIETTCAIKHTQNATPEQHLFEVTQIHDCAGVEYGRKIRNPQSPTLPDPL